MYSLETLLLAIAVAAVIAGLISFLISRRMSPDVQKQRELERNLDQLLEQQKDYQSEVVEHFTDTAKLLKTLSESYRDVHNHLANGASKLVENNSVTMLQPLPENTLADLSAEAEEAVTVEQPLDYAPKTSPQQPGMLNEEFGLDKTPPPPADGAAEPAAERAS